MTPEQKRALADALMDSAITTADEAAKLGLRDIPEGALRAACGLSDMPKNNIMQDAIQGIVRDRIALRLEELSNPPANRSEVREYATRETDLYRDLLSNLFTIEGLQPNPQAAAMALQQYYAKVSGELSLLGDSAGGMDLSPSVAIEVPTFYDMCVANGAGRNV